MSANLDFTIVINILTAASAVARAGFDWILVGVPSALADFGQNNNTRSYTSAASVDSDNDLDATVKTLCSVLFMQSNNPGKLIIGRIGDNVAESLAACKFEESRFYGVVLTTLGTGTLNQAAAWCEANDKLLVYSNNAADIKNNVAGNALKLAKAESYKHLAFLFSENTTNQKAALAWASAKLSANPDNRATVWSHCTLVGVAPDNLTDTQRDNILSDNGNVVLPLKGISATFAGKTVSGDFIDEIVARDWLKSRCEEAIAQLLLDMSSIQSKIPYTEAGIQQVASVVESVLLTGERIGHFRTGSSVVSIPDFSLIPLVDIQNRELTLSAEVTLAGAISQKITFNILMKD